MDEQTGYDVDETYNADYYRTHCGQKPYAREEPEWGLFFGGIADEIVRSLAPKTVFDAGCAHGFLVEALWDRGIEAYGRDISNFAVSQVRPDVRPFVEQGSLTDRFNGIFDLIVCIEVLEHMSEEEALQAIYNMADAAPRVLFSSSPIDIIEPTHINVKPTIWWLNKFADVGFAPVTTFDASFIAPHAFLLQKGPVTRDLLHGFVELIRQRLNLSSLRSQLAGLQVQLNQKQQELSDKHAELAKVVADHNVADATRLQEIDALTAKMTTAQAQSEQMETQIALLSNQLDEQRISFQKSVGRIQQLEAATNKHVDETDTLRNEIGRLTSIASVANAEKARLSAALSEALRLAAPQAQSPVQVVTDVEEINALRNHLHAMQAQLSSVQAERDMLKNSTMWRATAPVRVLGSYVPVNVRRRLTSLIGDRRKEPARGGFEPTDYDNWVRHNDTLTSRDRELIRSHIAKLQYKPLISVVMPTYNTKPSYLRDAIASIEAQLYDNWELCIADDASTNKETRRAIRREASKNKRIKVTWRSTNGHIAAASNSAIKLAKGEFILLMDHDDFLAETAMYEVVVALNDNKSLDMIYSDEDRMGPDKRRLQPYFKPDFNIDLMFGHNMFSHLGVYRRSLVESVGGFREGIVDGSQDYDLTLRCAAKTDKIYHIPAVLYHWRLDPEKGSFSQSQLDQCVAAARRAIADYLHSKHIKGAKVAPAKLAAEWSRVIWPLPVPTPKVSIIIPTRDRASLLSQCIGGVLDTDYDNFEVVIVDNGSKEESALFLLEQYSKTSNIRVVSYPGPFNYSAINNFGAKESSGDILVLLNNDTKVKDRNWLREMVSIVSRPDVGVVGAKLLYGDGRIQHAGVVVGVGTDGVAGHFGHYDDENSGGYVGQYALTREVSAVTGACLAVTKELYLELGGLDADNLPVSYNDVDFCLRVREHGLKVVWTPFAELFHYESASRGSDEDPDKIHRYRRSQAYMRQKWGRQLDMDPFYNPNFDYVDHTFKLATPTRRTKPWEGL